MQVLGGLLAATSTSPLASKPLVLVALGEGRGGAGAFTEDTFTKQTELLTELYLVRNYIQRRSSLRYWLVVYGTNAILK